MQRESNKRSRFLPTGQKKFILNYAIDNALKRNDGAIKNEPSSNFNLLAVFIESSSPSEKYFFQYLEPKYK